MAKSPGLKKFQKSYGLMQFEEGLRCMDRQYELRMRKTLRIKRLVQKVKDLQEALRTCQSGKKSRR